MSTVTRLSPPRPEAQELMQVLRGTPGPVPPTTLVIFGANGDLMEKREGRLALVSLAEAGVLDSVVPLAGHPLPARQYLKALHDGDADSRPISEAGFQKLVKAAHLDPEKQIPGVDVSSADDLKPVLAGLRGDALFYASLPPKVYGALLHALKASGLAARGRVVLEKPFGMDLASAQALHAQIERDYAAGQVLLVDHFLAYPGMLNLLSLRLHPDVDEMLSREYVERVDLRILETIKSNDRPYFRETGELVDLVQNHDMQLLSTLACALPKQMTGEALQQARTALIQSVRIDEKSVRRGQFEGFNDVEGMAPSEAETLVAFDFQVDRDTWRGVPFSLISAKGVAERRFGADVHLRRLPEKLAAHLGVPVDGPATLAVTVHPGQAFTLDVPGRRLEFEPDPRIADRPPHARLIEDAMKGDRALFVEPEAAIAAWEIVEQIKRQWAAQPLLRYAVGTPADSITSS